MKNLLLFLGIHTLLLFLCLGCASKSPPPPAKDSISVMTFNVENLFDTKDDPEKNDETFLPLSHKNTRILMKCSTIKKKHWRESCEKTNWTEKIVQRKMKRIADVIKQVKQGQGPDILILPEVENQMIIESLRKTYLSSLNYRKSVLIEGPDSRGIDVAILTKLEVLYVKSHPIAFEMKDDLTEADTQKATRDIIQVDLKLPGPDGQILTVLGVHFPAPFNPTGTRIQAIRRLNEIKDSLPKNRLVIAGGDFNITSREDHSKKLYKQQLQKKWGVSHYLGCQDCKGTYYYHREKSWSFLDALLFSKNMLPGTQGPWQVLTQSIRIPTHSLYQINRYGSPAKFQNGQSKVGVSDHWPVVAEIIPHQSNQQRK